MLTTIVFPGTHAVRVERLWTREGQVQVQAVTTGRFSRCPQCQRRSRHVHSHYQRTLADCPCLGQAVTVHLGVRRFRCRVRWCAQRVFSERLPEVARPWARRTERQRQSLERHAVDLGGKAGSRHCQAEAIAVSGRTLLRLIRHMPLPAVGAVRALGVDDWSLRRGQHYGTILVDLDSHEVLDLLPDRTAATVAAWLVQHPEIEVISRDRAGAYAEAARLGAPQATQVADRFHLDQSVTEALERYLLRQHQQLRQAAFLPLAAPEPAPCPLIQLEGAVAPPQAAAAEQERETEPAPAPRATTRAGRLAQVRRARRHALYAEVIALHVQGHSLRAIAATTGLARGTVHAFVRVGSFPERQPRAPRATQLTPFLGYLRERWDGGCHNALRLWQDLRTRGFTGGRTVVAALLHTWRAAPDRTPGAPSTPPLVPGPVYSSRATCWLLLKESATLSADEQAYLTRLLHLCPEVALAQALTREFQTLIRERDVPGLYSWLKGVRLSGIPEFGSVATGIWRDRRAVHAALTHPESQGQTEGFVNKLKFIKRSGYGRAGFDLLRRRVLLAS